MIHVDENTNAQGWELEVICKNREYLNAVVKAVLKYGMINFEVEVIDGAGNHDGVWEGRYSVLMWCSWFHNLNSLTKDLARIEKKFDNL